MIKQVYGKAIYGTEVLNCIDRNRRLKAMAHRTSTPSEELAKGNDREEYHMSKLFRSVLL